MLKAFNRSQVIDSFLSPLRAQIKRVRKVGYGYLGSESLSCEILLRRTPFLVHAGRLLIMVGCFHSRWRVVSPHKCRQCQARESFLVECPFRGSQHSITSQAFPSKYTILGSLPRCLTRIAVFRSSSLLSHVQFVWQVFYFRPYCHAMFLNLYFLRLSVYGKQKWIVTKPDHQSLQQLRGLRGLHTVSRFEAKVD